LLCWRSGRCPRARSGLCSSALHTILFPSRRDLFQHAFTDRGLAICSSVFISMMSRRKELVLAKPLVSLPLPRPHFSITTPRLHHLHDAITHHASGARGLLQPSRNPDLRPHPYRRLTTPRRLAAPGQRHQYANPLHVPHHSLPTSRSTPP